MLGVMPTASTVKPVIGAQLHTGGIDAVIAAIAQRQHGVVARPQLLALGLGRRAIGHRVECGRLHVVHRGVYSVGHPLLSIEGRWTAAVLAAGAGAALSHRAAAALWGLRATSAPRVEVSLARRLRSRRGVQIHHAPLAPDEVTVHHGIAVTTPPRTLLDLAAILRPDQLERAMNEAEARRLSDSLSLDALIDRHPARPGTLALKSILQRGRLGATLTRSELEDRFLSFLDAHDLDRPRVNVALALAGTHIEADCVWSHQRLIVELDGYATHATRAAFERDRTRDRRLQAAGWRVVRITWRHLHDEPAAVAAELRALLSGSIVDCAFPRSSARSGSSRRATATAVDSQSTILMVDSKSARP